MRYGVTRGESRRSEVVFPEGIATKALRGEGGLLDRRGQPHSRVRFDVVSKYKVQQFLAVPLLGTRGKLLGMFGVLDRLDGGGISQEDVRRARALSNQAAVMLEAANNLHLSEQHRRQAEALIDLAREIDGALRLPDFARRFVARTAELTGSACGLLAVPHEGHWHIAAICHPESVSAPMLVADESEAKAPAQIGSQGIVPISSVAHSQALRDSDLTRWVSSG